jgi:hypothetical protein
MTIITNALLVGVLGILITTSQAHATSATPTPHCDAHKVPESTQAIMEENIKLQAEIEAIKPPTTGGQGANGTFVDDPTTNINDIGDVGGDFEE